MSIPILPHFHSMSLPRANHFLGSYWEESFQSACQPFLANLPVPFIYQPSKAVWGSVRQTIDFTAWLPLWIPCGPLKSSCLLEVCFSDVLVRPPFIWGKGWGEHGSRSRSHNARYSLLLIPHAFSELPGPRPLWREKMGLTECRRSRWLSSEII